MNKAWFWIDTPQGVGEAVRDIASASLVGVDTEYDSFRYFREKLCLIQIRAGETTYLFDPLDGLDLSSLQDCFADPRLLKVMHAGDNDVRIYAGVLSQGHRQGYSPLCI